MAGEKRHSSKGREQQDMPAVFTPGNEPYLGLPSIMWFDRIIVWAMRGSALVVARTHEVADSMSPLQRASAQVIPQGFSIALSIRELIRQGYLLSSLVLMRPLIERAAVISYLCTHEEAIALWEDGWRHRSRPSLATMMEAMAGALAGVEEAKLICWAHNHIVHGDPIGSYYNMIQMPDGGITYSSSKIVDAPDMADAIAMEAQCYLVVLGARMGEIWPEVPIPRMPDQLV